MASAIMPSGWVKSEELSTGEASGFASTAHDLRTLLSYGYWVICTPQGGFLKGPKYGLRKFKSAAAAAAAADSLAKARASEAAQ